MDYYAIGPFKHLNLVWHLDRHLLIVPYLDEFTNYAEFYLGLDKGDDQQHFILDTGIIETQTSMTDTTLDWAKQFQGKVTLVAPDYWKDPVRTIKNTRAYVEGLSRSEREKYRIMGVPHGKNIREFLSCASKLSDWVDILGLPYKEWGDPYGYSRVFMLKFGLHQIMIDWHLLGLWNVEELLYHNLPNVVSFDTSMPFRLANRKMLLEDVTIMTESFDWNMKLNLEQRDIAATNVTRLKQIANAEKRELFHNVN